MTKVVKLRLLPTGPEERALKATLHACNTAATWLSACMHAAGVHRKYDAQKQFYPELRQRFGLSAQPAIRVIAKVADAYTTLGANISAGNYGPPGSKRRKKVQNKPIDFRIDGAQPFDARCLSWLLPECDDQREATASIWTVEGRLRRVRMLALPKDFALLRTQTVHQTNLVHRDGNWFLHATIEVPEWAIAQPINGFVGVDMGIVNIATTSNGRRLSGSRLTRYRNRQMQLRQRLQAKKTASARRLLKNRRRKEARFASDINHQISKSIVAEAERTGCGVAIEHLGGIRDRVRLRKPQRAALHSWAFAQLGNFLAYKAKAVGVAFVQVDPAHTSQMCSACGWTDKGNRLSQSVFQCGRCRFVGHADHNAALNIAARGVERWGEVMRPDAAPTLAAS
jgi:putative transposase